MKLTMIYSHITRSGWTLVWAVSTLVVSACSGALPFTDITLVPTIAIPTTPATIPVHPSATPIPTATPPLAPSITPGPVRPSATPIPTSTPTPAHSITPTPTALPSATAMLAQSCVSGDATWRQIHAPSGFIFHDGYASDNGCQLWLVGEQVNPTHAGALVRSEDGGQNFANVASFSDALHVWRIAFSGPTAAWIGGDTLDGHGLLLQSTDAGQNWQPKALPPEITAVTGLVGIGNQVWVAAQSGVEAVILASNDSSENWQEIVRLSSSDPRQAARFVDLAVSGSTVMMIGTDGTHGIIMVSSDSGKTFSPISRLNDLTTASTAALLDAQHAYIGGYFSTTGRMEEATAVLLRTADGGASWEKLPLPGNASVVTYALFPSAETGYAILGAGIEIAHKAGDGSLTWEAATLEPKPLFGLERLFAAQNGTLYAVGVGGIYRSKP